MTTHEQDDAGNYQEELERQRCHHALWLLVKHVEGSENGWSTEEGLRWEIEARYVLGGTVVPRGFAVADDVLADELRTQQAKAAMMLLEGWSSLTDGASNARNWQELIDQMHDLVASVPKEYMRQVGLEFVKRSLAPSTDADYGGFRP